MNYPAYHEYWRVSSSGIWRRVVRRVSTDVSGEHIASIFRVKNRFSTCFLAGLLNLFLYPEDGDDVPPKRRLKLDGLHGVISQRMILFITIAVKTSDPTMNIDYISISYGDHRHKYKYIGAIFRKTMVRALEAHKVAQYVHIPDCIITGQQWCTENQSIRFRR
jgi:hypothetical protein